MNITIDDAEDSWVYMEYRIDDIWIRFDSAELKSGHAVFTGELEYPRFFFIKLKDQTIYLPGFVEAGTVTMMGSVKNSNKRSVKGSKSQDEFAFVIDSLNTFSRSIRDLGMIYQKARGSNDTVLMKQLENEHERLSNQKKTYLMEYALSHTNSVVPIFIVLNNIYSYDLEELDELNSSLDLSIRNSIYAKELSRKVTALK